MLFTNEGVFANYCMHPSNSIDREYLVRAKGSFNSDKEAQMRKGIEIDGSIHKFSDLVEGEKTGANQWFSACLTSGKNKEVRKLFEAVGMTVSRLKRTRYGPIFLPSTLAEGKCKELTENEILSLRSLNYFFNNKLKKINILSYINFLALTKKYLLILILLR